MRWATSFNLEWFAVKGALFVSMLSGIEQPTSIVGKLSGMIFIQFASLFLAG
jgi:hypothetical protein